MVKLFWCHFSGTPGSGLSPGSVKRVRSDGLACLEVGHGRVILAGQ